MYWPDILKEMTSKITEKMLANRSAWLKEIGFDEDKQRLSIYIPHITDDTTIYQEILVAVPITDFPNGTYGDIDDLICEYPSKKFYVRMGTHRLTIETSNPRSTPENLRDRIDEALSTFGPTYGRRPDETSKRVGKDELVIFRKGGPKLRVKVEEIE